MNQFSVYCSSFARMRDYQLCIGLLLIAFLARVIGIDYGYWHSDERINDAARILSGQWMPTQHFYPPLFNYINAVFFALLYVGGRITFAWSSVSEFRSQYFADPTAFYMTARLVTAMLGAAVAPLFYLIARSLKFDKSRCLLMAMFGVFIPVMVLLCHISKSDIPLATSAILVFYVLLEKYKHLFNWKYDVFLGLSITLALSFKHSYVFILAPLMFGHAYLLWRKTDFPSAFKSLVITGAWMLATWCVLNLGILLDLQNFLDYQKIQAQMSLVGGGAYAAAFTAWFSWSAHTAFGVNGIVTVLFLVFPIYVNSRFCGLNSKSLLNVFWCSISFGTLVIILVSGTRQHSGLWVPYFTCMQLFVAVMLIDVLQSPLKNVKRVGFAATALTLAISCYGSLTIWQQALAQPIDEKIVQLVKQGLSQKKILASFDVALPQSKAAIEAEYSRHQRLAKKYGLALEAPASERFVEVSAEESVFWVTMPEVMFGLELTDDASLGAAMKAHTWPLQKQEWQLSYWLAQGFSVFIMADHDYHLHDTPSLIFRGFHRELETDCNKISEFKPTKPYFLEPTVTVFECEAAAAGNPAAS